MWCWRSWWVALAGGRGVRGLLEYALVLRLSAEEGLHIAVRKAEHVGGLRLQISLEVGSDTDGELDAGVVDYKRLEAVRCPL